jgi:hypothetical protein
MIMVYYYFSFLGFVNSQDLPNAMKKTFNYKKFPSHQKGPKTKKKLTQKNLVKHVMKTTLENIYSVFEGWISLHNRTYKNEFVRALDGKFFMP